MRHSGRFTLCAAALAVALLCTALWGEAQPPAPSVPPLPRPIDTQDTVRVTIVPGHSVTIWAEARRVTMRHSGMSSEAIIEIDTSPLMAVKP